MDLSTPCFIIDEEELKKNIDNMHSSLKKYWNNYIIGYSYKTNSLPWILSFLKENNCYAEVVSDTEYRLAKKVGYKDENIIFNGPNKGIEIIELAINNGAIVNIDSIREINIIKNFNFQNEVKVGIRVNFNLERECPNETAMGNEGGRFGISLETGELKQAIQELNSISNVKVVGIHLHNSTKTRSLNIYKALSKKACEIAKLFNYELEYVDIGGGFYGGLENKPSYDQYMEVISKELKRNFNVKCTKLIIEPGAALIASPISFLCEVIDIKDTYANRIVTVNGSRNNIDPLMRKQNYFYEVVAKENRKSVLNKQIIAGYTCMEDDRLLEVNNKEEIKCGDKILFNKVGSYTMTLSPLFIEYFPIVYLKNKYGEYVCIRERWDIEEYIQKSVINIK